MNKRTIALAAFAATAASGQTADQPPITVFNILLDRPFTVPECSADAPAGKVEVCWMYTFKGLTDDDARAFRLLRFAEVPSIGTQITAHVEKGTLVSFTIQTSGIATQDYTLRELTEKFGKPTLLKREPVQNAMGAQFVVVRAQWDKPSVYVQFDADGTDDGGSGGSIDQGWISITTHGRHLEKLRRRDEFFRSRKRL